jgi:hypothetical protein
MWVWVCVIKKVKHSALCGAGGYYGFDLLQCHDSIHINYNDINMTPVTSYTCRTFSHLLNSSLWTPGHYDWLAVTWLWHWLDFRLDHPIPEGYIYTDLSLQVGGGLEYLQHSPASRKRRRKCKPQIQDRKFQTATFRQEISDRKSHKGARYQEILTDWLTVSRKVTSTSTNGNHFN